MVDMLRTSSSGSTVKLAQSREELAQLQIVIIDVLMNFEQSGAQSDLFYSLFPIAALVSCSVSHNDCSHINCHYF